MLCDRMRSALAGACWALALGVVSSVHGPPPRVALLFISRQSVYLEPVWVKFLDGVAGLKAPAFSQEQQDALFETSRIEELTSHINSIGRLQETQAVLEAPCVSNDLLLVRHAPADARLLLIRCQTASRPWQASPEVPMQFPYVACRRQQ